MSDLTRNKQARKQTSSKYVLGTGNSDISRNMRVTKHNSLRRRLSRQVRWNRWVFAKSLIDNGIEQIQMDRFLVENLSVCVDAWHQLVAQLTDVARVLS